MYLYDILGEFWKYYIWLHGYCVVPACLQNSGALQVPTPFCDIEMCLVKFTL